MEHLPLPDRIGDNTAAFQPANAVLEEYSFTHAHPLIGRSPRQESSLWGDIETATDVTPVDIGEKPNGLPQQSWGSSSLSDAVRDWHTRTGHTPRPHDPSI